MFIVYILQSIKDQTFYVGHTVDLEKRLAEHNAGKSRYTKGRRPYKIVFRKRLSSLKIAKELERTITNGKNIPRYLKMEGCPASKDAGLVPTKAGES